MSRAAGGPTALDLVEEAAHLLRRAPLSTLALYYLGSAPFVLGLLFFWADMSRSAVASERCATGALGLALLFAWMKLCQAAFAAALRRQRIGGVLPAGDGARGFGIAASQILCHALGTALLPVAALLTLPVGWVYAWCQNVTAIGGAEPGGFRATSVRAWRQATLWPGQNHLLLTLLSGFGLAVFINVAVAMLVVPGLLKTLLGVETAFTGSPSALTNTTFLAVAAGLTYLCVDPLCKAVYLLRVFYGESLYTGADLEAEQRGLGAGVAPTVAALLAGLALCGLLVGAAAQAADAGFEAPTTSRAASVTPAALDQAIARTLRYQEFRWRLPREETEQGEQEGLLAAFLGQVWRLLQDAASWVEGGVQAVLSWLDHLFPDRDRAGPERGRDGLPSVRSLLALGLLLLVGLLAVALFRVLRRPPKTVTTAANPKPPVPDLRDETMAADRLPANDWMSLAHRLLDDGEPRLALRALYLASLAHLAHQGLLRIAPHKSNRDYRDELAARAHVAPEVAEAFASNVRLFERVWYGMHAPTGALTRDFSSNQKRILGFVK